MIGGKELEQAIGDCDQAQKLAPQSVEIRDTRGFVYLRMGDFAKAVAEYNVVLQVDPNHARALYGRGFAKTKTGDTTGGAADIAAASKFDANVAREYARIGLK